MKKRLRGAWPSVRAGLILLHVIAVVALSFPSAAKMGDPKRWRDPRTQAQLALWGDRLRDFGWDISDQELEARLWTAAQSYLGARGAIVAPFEPYGRVVPQFWGMFKAPASSPSYIAIDVDEGGPDWRTVHESRSPEHDYLAETLDHNRFRKQIGRVGSRPELFADVSRWLATRAFADFPAARRVRVRVVRRESPTPEARQAGTPIAERTESTLVFRREDGQ
jgi:hypothetical protein